jgi:hypothetical protein
VHGRAEIYVFDLAVRRLLQVQKLLALKGKTGDVAGVLDADQQIAAIRVRERHERLADILGDFFDLPRPLALG